MRRAPLLAVLGLIFVAAPVSAQCDTDNEYMDVVRSQAIAAGAAYGAEGYELVDVLCGSLNEDGEERYTTSVGAGKDIAYIAVCDQDCDDIDLRLYNSSGREVAADIEPDDFPIVVYSSRNGESGMEIEVGMYSCSVEPCYYAIAMFSRGEQTPTETPAPAEKKRPLLEKR